MSGVFGWEADTNAIVEHISCSDGLSAVVYYPLDEFNDGLYPGTVSGAFGGKLRNEGPCSLQWEEGGFTWKGRGSDPEGNTISQVSVSRRVAPMTENTAKDWLAYFDGAWETNFGPNGGPNEIITYALGGDENGLPAKSIRGNITGVEYSGWQPGMNRLVSTGHGSDGAVWEARYDEAGDGFMKGAITGRLDDGSLYEGIILLTRISEDRYTYALDVLCSAERLELTGDSQRIE